MFRFEMSCAISILICVFVACTSVTAQDPPTEIQTKEALGTIGLFLRSEPGTRWLSELAKTLSSPLTTIELMKALRTKSNAELNVLQAAEIVERTLEAKKRAGFNPDGSGEVSSSDELDTILADIQKHNDIICLYRKDGDTAVKKDEDWRNFLKSMPSDYTLYLALDKGNKYFICLKKIKVPKYETSTTTPEAIIIEPRFMTSTTIKRPDEPDVAIGQALGNSLSTETPMNAQRSLQAPSTPSPTSRSMGNLDASLGPPVPLGPGGLECDISAKLLQNLQGSGCRPIVLVMSNGGYNLADCSTLLPCRCRGGGYLENLMMQQGYYPPGPLINKYNPLVGEVDTLLGGYRPLMTGLGSLLNGLRPPIGGMNPMLAGYGRYGDQRYRPHPYYQKYPNQLPGAKLQIPTGLYPRNGLGITLPGYQNLLNPYIAPFNNAYRKVGTLANLKRPFKQLMNHLRPYKFQPYGYNWRPERPKVYQERNFGANYNTKFPQLPVTPNGMVGASINMPFQQFPYSSPYPPPMYPTPMYPTQMYPTPIYPTPILPIMKNSRNFKKLLPPHAVTPNFFPNGPILPNLPPIPSVPTFPVVSNHRIMDRQDHKHCGSSCCSTCGCGCGCDKPIKLQVQLNGAGQMPLISSLDERVRLMASNPDSQIIMRNLPSEDQNKSTEKTSTEKSATTETPMMTTIGNTNTQELVASSTEMISTSDKL